MFDIVAFIPRAIGQSVPLLFGCSGIFRIRFRRFGDDPVIDIVSYPRFLSPRSAAAQYPYQGGHAYKKNGHSLPGETLIHANTSPVTYRLRYLS